MAFFVLLDSLPLLAHRREMYFVVGTAGVSKDPVPEATARSYTFSQ